MNISVSPVKKWLIDHAGIEPGLLERAWLDRLIAERIHTLRVSDEHEYCSILDAKPQERQWIVEQISVNETWFFRYPESFRLLLEHLRTLRAQRENSPHLSILSVACATGEEPYSIAMAAMESGWQPGQMIIHALDRNEHSLEIARRASYPCRTMHDDTPTWAAHWLIRRQDQYHVDPQIARLVNFLPGDAQGLLPAGLLSHYDVVFCRNLMIYLNQQAREKLIERLAHWLIPDGMLFVGHAERLEILNPHFCCVNKPHTFAMRALAPKTDCPQSLVPTTPFRLNGSAAEPESTTTTGSVRHQDEEVSQSFASPSCHGSAADRAAIPAVRSGKSIGAPQRGTTLTEARNLADSGHLQEALHIVEQASASEKPRADSLNLLGSIHLGLGNLSEARRALIKSLYLDPYQEECLLQLAALYGQLGNEELATRYRVRAAKLYQHDSQNAAS